MKLVVILFCLLTINAIGQKISSCACRGIIDPDYKGFVSIYDKPNGITTKSIKHDLKNEDYLVFKIDKVTDSFFHVKLEYAINGKSFQGWISKSKHLITYLRNYDSAISLYSKYNTSSKVKAVIPSSSSSSFQIIDCKENWIYIKEIIRKSHKSEGWLKSEDQCANPYTTCS